MKPEPLKIQNLNKPDGTVVCQFNPTEYTISKTADWKEGKQTGKNVPKFDYGGGGPKTITMQLLFDVFEQDDAKDLKAQLSELWALVHADKETKPPPKDKRSRPPQCHVQWGNHWEFTAAVTSLKVRYLLFREDGRPARAMVDITFVQTMDDEAKKRGPTNPSSFAEPGYSRREVQPHDTLAWIAYEEYGAAAQWRLIANANRIEDPLSLVPGQVLAIPPPP